jgi:hypothetical protein
MQMILIPKPGKPPHAPSSYQPISLLPIASKVFEKLLLNQLLLLVEHGKLLPTHQFGFRPKNSTIEQTHRLIRGINNAIDNSQYCSAAFLDISQAFDNSQTLPLSTQGYSKSAPSAPYYTSYAQPTFSLHLTPSQLLLPTTLQSSSCHCFPETPSLPPRNSILAKHLAYES